MAWAAQLANCSPHELLDFSASVSPLGPPPSVLHAIQTHLETLRQYPDPAYRDLRQAIAHHHDIDADWVLPGNGAAELLTWAGRDMAQWSGVGLITPAFADYGRSLRAHHLPIYACPLPLDHACQGTVDGLKLLDSGFPTAVSRADCGLLLNTPHNPTGLLLPSDLIDTALLQFAQVVIDEAFMDFLPPPQQRSRIACIAHHPNLTILRSLTKFYSLPGLRLGYAIAHPDRLRRWQQWRDPWPVNALAAAAAIAAFQDQAYQQATWQWLPPARDALATALNDCDGLKVFPGAANYLLVRSDRVSVPDLQHHLLQHHRLLIRDCLSFPELGDRYFRIAVRTPDDNQTLAHAIKTALVALSGTTAVG